MVVALKEKINRDVERFLSKPLKFCESGKSLPLKFILTNQSQDLYRKKFYFNRYM